jgi:FMN-dependent dehydrogenase
MPVITTVEDLRVLAQKRVPRMFYDYADSGSWTESTYRANSDDFQKIKLRQRVAVNMENRTTATTMVGQYAKSALPPLACVACKTPMAKSRPPRRLKNLAFRSLCRP